MRPAKTTMLLALTVLAACAAPMDLPTDFSALRDAEFRATTSDDAILSIREVADPTRDGSSAKFWIDALRRDFIDQRGYQLLDSGEVKDADGVEGRWLECSANVRGERIDYLIAVWPRPSALGLRAAKLQILEFAAPQAVFAARRAAVHDKLKTVRG